MNPAKIEEGGLNATKCSNEKHTRTITFYIGAFFLGIFVVPILGIIAPTFMFFGVVTPLLGLVKLAGYLFNFAVPYVSFQVGDFELNPIIGFPLSIAVGLILHFAGREAWKLLLKYGKYIHHKQSELER